jgi:single-strand DNA-binding protein
MANSFETVGTLSAVMETQQVTDTFKKREFVIEIADGQYPQHIKFQVVQDKTALLDQYSVGQQIRVLFNLKGRAYQKRDGGTDYWLNLDAWRIESAEGAAPGSTGYNQIAPAQSTPGAQDFDDVPF